MATTFEEFLIGALKAPITPKGTGIAGIPAHFLQPCPFPRFQGFAESDSQE